MNKMVKGRLKETEKHDWKEYLVDFDTQEGTFTVSIYALSFEHASYRLEELKATGRLVGELVEEFDV